MAGFSICGRQAALFRQLCETTDWVDAGENVLLFGASDLGKSHLAAAIVDGVIGLGYRSRYYSAGELLQELRKARTQLKLNELLLKLDRYRVIVIDDLEYVKRDNAETGVLFELLAHRYERGSLVITSNHPFSTWGSSRPADPSRIYVRAKRRKLPEKDSEGGNQRGLKPRSMDAARVVGASRQK